MGFLGPGLGAISFAAFSWISRFVAGEDFALAMPLAVVWDILRDLPEEYPDFGFMAAPFRG